MWYHIMIYELFATFYSRGRTGEAGSDLDRWSREREKVITSLICGFCRGSMREKRKAREKN
jgi:hypothetical protein